MDKIRTPWEEGDPSSSICFLLEAPGKIEMKAGRPIVGPSGYLLEECMKYAKIFRREVYVLNTFPFSVSKDKVGVIRDESNNILWHPKKGYTAEGREATAGQLDKIRKCSANVICTMGNPAMDLLLDIRSITKWRGSNLVWMESTGGFSFKKRKVIPCLHPAFILRGNILYKDVLVHDLKIVEKESKKPDLYKRDYTLHIDPSFQDATEYMLAAGKTIATDIECLNNQVSCFCITPTPDETMCIPLIGRHGGPRWTEEEECTIWDLYAGLMGDPSVMKINQNMFFDMSFLLMQNGIITRGEIGDPMVAHHMIYTDYPKGLDFLTSMHTNMPYYKDDGKLWKKPWADSDTFWRYNGMDGISAFRVWNALQDDLDNGYRQTYDETIDIFDCLLYMYVKGIKIDLELLKGVKEDVVAKLDIKYKELKDTAEVDFNPLSPKQCQEYFYGTLGYKAYTNRKTGKPTTDDKAMARLVSTHGVAEARIVQDIRGLEKLRGTYLEIEFDADQRLRCSWNPRGTVTGRLSSSKTIGGKGMNMQNLDPVFKGFMIGG